MGQLGIRILILGNLMIHRGGVPLPAFPTRASEGLFAYLVVNRDRLFHRDSLCGEFWGEHPEAQARKALRTELWRVRSVLEADPSDRGTLVRVEGDQIGFVASPRVWVDVWELEECARMGETLGEGLDGAVADRLGRAAELYRGDFLEAHYDDWCFFHRERLRLTFLTVLERLLNHHCRKGNWLGAIRWARELLRRDPLREHVHRILMICHHVRGDRPSALRQYGDCVRLLREELDIEPMAETRDLYARIRGGDRPLGSDEWRSEFGERQGENRWGMAAEVDRALEQVYALTARLERARDALQSGGSARAGLPPAS